MLRHRKDGQHRRGNEQKCLTQGRDVKKFHRDNSSQSRYANVSLHLWFRNNSDGSEEDDEDEDSDYGAMAEQLEGFLGDEADNDDEYVEQDEESI